MDEWLSIEVLPAERRIELAVRGNLNLPLLWKVMAAMEATPGADPTFDLLFDGSELVVDDADIRELSRFEAKVPTSRVRLAIVGCSDLHFGIVNHNHHLAAPLAPRHHPTGGAP